MLLQRQILKMQFPSPRDHNPKKLCLGCWKVKDGRSDYCKSCFQLGSRNHQFGKKTSPETIEKLRRFAKGRKRPDISKILSGRKRPDTSKRLSECQFGENNPGWKGGITPLFVAIRNRPEYDVWRKAVFDRDGYTCQNCGSRKGGTFIAHHQVKTFAEIVYANNIKTVEQALDCSELWDISYGVIMCRTCHDETLEYAMSYKKVLVPVPTPEGRPPIFPLTPPDEEGDYEEAVPPADFNPELWDPDGDEEEDEED